MTTMTPAEFGHVIYPNLPPDVRIHTFKLPQKQSSNLQAAAALDAFAGRTDAYIGVCVVDKTNAKRRIRNDTAAGVAALALDLDIIGTPDGRGGVKTTGAPTFDEAINLAKSILEPTIIVHTGNGIHAWYVLDHIARIRDADQRARWQHMFYVFADAHHTEAARRGYEIDHVQDLARIMRIVGTINTKPDEPAPVTVLEHSAAYYTPTQLVEALRRVEAWRDYSADDPVPIRYIEAEDRDDRDLAELLNDTRYAHLNDLVEHRRGKDGWSLSEYDLSLATRAVAGGWTDNEVAALIQLHRDRWGSDKGSRADYIARTIHKARESAAQNRTIADDRNAQMDALIASLADKPAPTEPIVEPDQDVYELLTDDEIDQLEDPTWLADGAIPANSLTVTFGASGSYKSFDVIDLGMSIAAGIPWHGRRTQQGRVIYVLAEGRSGIKKRRRAWLRHRSIDRVPRFHLLPHSVPLTEPAALSKLIATAHSLPDLPTLIIVDTLARSMPGSDENSTQDMSRLVAALDTIRMQTGAGVHLVHHTGHDKTRERGNSALRAAADAMIKVTKNDNGTVTIACSKQKDADEFPAETYVFNEVLGTLSGVLVPAGANALVDTSPGSPHAIAEYVDNHGGEAWVDDVCEAFGISRDTFDRRRGELERIGFWIGNEQRGRVKATKIRRRDATANATAPHGTATPCGSDIPSIDAGSTLPHRTLPQDTCGTADSLYSSQNDGTARYRSLRESPTPAAAATNTPPLGVDPSTGELRRCAECDHVITDHGYHGSWCSSACFHRASTEVDDA